MPKVLKKMIANKTPLVVVRQTGKELYKAKERLPAWIMTFSQEKDNAEDA